MSHQNLTNISHQNTRQTPAHLSTQSSSNRLGVQRIGPYALGKTLGVGSTGRVKLGTHIESNNHVAIKIIPKDSLSQEKSENGKPLTPAKRAALNKKIEREITIMKLIQHPNVMQLYDVYETEKELFLILEHIEGGELFDYLVQKGRLSESEALIFFQQIILGVEFCHRHLICHRDLKPENLLLDKNLNVKIADFGMASIQGPGRMLETSCGSPHYASPEIIKGIKYDGPAADVWSCGVILYALLTGNLPFDDENIRRLLSKVKSGMYFTPDHISPNAKDLIKRMLVVDPSKRITMQEVMRHPWFTSQAPKNGNLMLQGAMENKTFAEPVTDISTIDPEIVNSLTLLLGWGNEEDITKDLMSPKPNTVKVFYNLLSQRKWSFFENFDIRKMNEWDVEGGARRRTDSYSSLEKNSSKGDIFKSDVSLISPQSSSPQLNNSAGSDHSSGRKSIDELRDMRKSADELRKDSPEKNHVKGNEPCASVGNLLNGQRAQSNNAKTVRVNSPLAVSTTNSGSQDSYGTGNNSGSNTEILNSPIQSPPPTSPDPELRLPERAYSPNDTQRQTGAKASKTLSPMRTQFKKLMISIPSNEEPRNVAVESGIASAGVIRYNPNKNAMRDIVGTSGMLSAPTTSSDNLNLNSNGNVSPKFHRKIKEVPPTPLITTPPKRSWFSSLLNFKPEVFTLVSNKPLDETHQYVIEKLKLYEVKFQSRKDGGLKCKYEGGTNNAVQPSSGSHNSSAEATPPSPYNPINNTSTSSIRTPGSPIPSRNRPLSTVSTNATNNSRPNSSIFVFPVNNGSSTSINVLQNIPSSPLNSPLPTGKNHNTSNGSLTHTPPLIAPKEPAIKSCKFKIEFLDRFEDEGVIKVLLYHQQGAFSTFQIVVNKLKSQWSL